MANIKKIHSDLCYAGHALLDLDSDKYIIIYSRSKGVFQIVKDGISPDGYCYRNSGIYDYWTTDDIKDIQMQSSSPDYPINDF